MCICFGLSGNLAQIFSWGRIAEELESHDQKSGSMYPRLKSDRSVERGLNVPFIWHWEWFVVKILRGFDFVARDVSNGHEYATIKQEWPFLSPVRTCGRTL